MAEKIPVPLTIDWAKGAEDTIREGYRQELGREADRDGFWAWFIEALRGRTGAQIRQALHDSPEGVAHREAPPPPIVTATMPILRPRAKSRLFFDADGRPVRWRGVSAFRLADKFRRGEAIDPFLVDYHGFNVLRVWPYVKGSAWNKGGGRSDWPTPPTVAEAKAFCAYVGARGFAVEFTLLTDGDPARLPWAQAFLAGLAEDPRPQNLLIELVNEPSEHDKHDPLALRAAAEAAGFPYASGEYKRSKLVFGTYGVTHPARTDDWARRSHDLMEFFKGGGPNTQEDPPHECAQVADEPAKPQDVGLKDADWRAFYGGCSLFGAGATFHCESGKYADRPSPEESRCAQNALRGLTAFPADAPNGAYHRIVEPNNSKEGRTYVVGSSMVRCLQPGVQAPEPGWAPLDDLGVLWRRA